MPRDASAAVAVPARTVPEGPDQANGPTLNGILRTARSGTRREVPPGRPPGATRAHINGTRNLRSDSSYVAGSAFHIAACGAPLTVCRVTVLGWAAAR